MKRTRYQFGTVALKPRKKGPNVWVYRWQEYGPGGRGCRRSRIIGTLKDYPTRDSALRKAEASRMEANAGQPSREPVFFGGLVDRYVASELASEVRHSTKRSYLSILNVHIKPRWADVPLSKVDPLDPDFATVLLAWKQRCPESSGGWVFPSPVTSRPYHASPIQQDYIRSAGRKLGLGNIGWHTFRHTYRSWLDSSGAPLGVQQKLMRHADIRTTMNVYGNALMDSKRQANSKVVQMVLRPVRKDAKGREARSSDPSYLTLTDPRQGKLGIASS